MAKRGAPSAAGVGGSSPLYSSLILVGSVVYAVVLLVQKGRMSWPPYQLLASTFTLFGCVGLAGPLILARREPGQAFLGELVWLACGILILVYDLASISRGDWRTSTWPTPLSPQTLGLVALAVLLAGWRCGIAAKSWTWTNMLGLLLALFWVSMGVWTVCSNATTRSSAVARASGSLDGPW